MLSFDNYCNFYSSAFHFHTQQTQTSRTPYLRSAHKYTRNKCKIGNKWRTSETIHCTSRALISFTINRVHYTEFQQMHCSLLSLARMNHFQNVDIVKLRKSERHIIRWWNDKAEIESKGINAHELPSIHHGSQSIRAFNGGASISFCSVPLFGAFLFRPIHFLSLSLSIACFLLLFFVNYIEQLFSCGFISVIYTLVFPFHLILYQAKIWTAKVERLQFVMRCVRICLCFCANVWFGHR